LALSRLTGDSVPFYRIFPGFDFRKEQTSQSFRVIAEEVMRRVYKKERDYLHSLPLALFNRLGGVMFIDESQKLKQV